MRRLLILSMAVFLYAGCSREAPPPPSSEPETPAPFAAGRLFVTNENGGDITVIDVAAARAVATIPVGKRPRGIRVSPDGSTLFIALSGSPSAPPGVDESTLPPPDKKADGTNGGKDEDAADPKEYFGYKRDLESLCEFMGR